ncbi:hypothetical protein P879_05559 [Paragonimus westermani]|uniref:17beta-estradiol 17-dehydrogenase / very-long-chain 3-oxoacyl-CoA reductase n=1 Tax=Paragonimus westermani TaxID=34504 RepID=A0A8T0D4E2_9TREM|nr:hypothetical protein P879_05559 [Paragonimus westermani]
MRNACGSTAAFADRMVAFLFWIGFACLIWHLIIPLLTILFHYSIGRALYSKRKQLKQAGQWAIITGSTDGIGKAFAEELASDGLNIMLISRNSEKLQAVAGELSATYNVSVRCVTADFTEANIYESIKKEIDSLSSIACLVNNVGMVNANPEEFAFSDGMCEENIRKFVACNCLSMASMTHIVLPRLIVQNSGAALINLSSYSGYHPLPYISLYAATKAFVCHLSQSLNLEVQGKNVVMQTLIPIKRKQLKRAGQWAIITGGTDGIGKAFAEELASDGLNIMLISRNSEKLQAVAGELGATYNVSVRCVTADFTQADVYENIKKEVDSLPSIACLINNVGMSNASREEFAFADGMCEENIRNFVACNCLSMASMTHIVLPRLIMQNSGAALINLSSYAGRRPLPYISLYAATKAFAYHLSQSLNLEVQGKNVVMQTLIPISGCVLTSTPVSPTRQKELLNLRGKGRSVIKEMEQI